jgi:hypothetical protein
MRSPLYLAAGVLALSACAGARSAVLAGAPGPEPAPEAVRSPDRVGDGLEPAPLATNAGAIEGVVAEVDRASGSVSLRTGDTVRTVPLAAEATVLIDDFRGGFEDVQEGQEVRAALEETDGQVEVVRIEILNQAVATAKGGAAGAAAPDGEPSQPAPTSPSR